MQGSWWYSSGNGPLIRHVHCEFLVDGSHGDVGRSAVTCPSSPLSAITVGLGIHRATACTLQSRRGHGLLIQPN